MTDDDGGFDAVDGRSDGKSRRGRPWDTLLKKFFRKVRTSDPQQIPEPVKTSSGTGSALFCIRSRSASDLSSIDIPIESSSRSPVLSDVYANGLAVSHDSVFAGELQDDVDDEDEIRFAPKQILLSSVQDELRAALLRRQTKVTTVMTESEEDLGLPRSPASVSPPSRDPLEFSRRGGNGVNFGLRNRKGSDGSMLSMDYVEHEEDSNANVNFNSRVAFQNSINMEDRSPQPEPDGETTAAFPLNHAAARHKMAVRPKRAHVTSRARNLQHLSSVEETPIAPEQEGNYRRARPPGLPPTRGSVKREDSRRSSSQVRTPAQPPDLSPKLRSVSLTRTNERSLSPPSSPLPSSRLARSRSGAEKKLQHEVESFQRRNSGATAVNPVDEEKGDSETTTPESQNIFSRFFPKRRSSRKNSAELPPIRRIAAEPQDSRSAPQDSRSAPQDSRSAQQDSRSTLQDSRSAPQDSRSAPQDSRSTLQDSRSAPALPPKERDVVRKNSFIAEKSEASKSRGENRKSSENWRLSCEIEYQPEIRPENPVEPETTNFASFFDRIREGSRNVTKPVAIPRKNAPKETTVVGEDKGYESLDITPDFLKPRKYSREENPESRPWVKILPTVNINDLKRPSEENPAETAPRFKKQASVEAPGSEVPSRPTRRVSSFRSNTEPLPIEASLNSLPPLVPRSDSKTYSSNSPIDKSFESLSEVDLNSDFILKKPAEVNPAAPVIRRSLETLKFSNEGLKKTINSLNRHSQSSEQITQSDNSAHKNSNDSLSTGSSSLNISDTEGIGSSYSLSRESLDNAIEKPVVSIQPYTTRKEVIRTESTEALSSLEFDSMSPKKGESPDETGNFFEMSVKSPTTPITFRSFTEPFSAPEIKGKIVTETAQVFGKSIDRNDKISEKRWQDNAREALAQTPDFENEISEVILRNKVPVLFDRKIDDNKTAVNFDLDLKSSVYGLLLKSKFSDMRSSNYRHEDSYISQPHSLDSSIGNDRSGSTIFEIPVLRKISRSEIDYRNSEPVPKKEESRPAKPERASLMKKQEVPEEFGRNPKEDIEIIEAKMPTKISGSDSAELFRVFARRSLKLRDVESTTTESRTEDQSEKGQERMSEKKPQKTIEISKIPSPNAVQRTEISSARFTAKPFQKETEIKIIRELETPKSQEAELSKPVAYQQIKSVVVEPLRVEPSRAPPKHEHSTVTAQFLPPKSVVFENPRVEQPARTPMKTESSTATAQSSKSVVFENLRFEQQPVRTPVKTEPSPVTAQPVKSAVFENLRVEQPARTPLKMEPSPGTAQPPKSTVFENQRVEQQVRTSLKLEPSPILTRKVDIEIRRADPQPETKRIEPKAKDEHKANQTESKEVLFIAKEKPSPRAVRLRSKTLPEVNYTDVPAAKVETVTAEPKSITAVPAYGVSLRSTGNLIVNRTLRVESGMDGDDSNIWKRISSQQKLTTVSEKIAEESEAAKRFASRQSKVLDLVNNFQRLQVT